MRTFIRGDFNAVAELKLQRSSRRSFLGISELYIQKKSEKEKCDFKFELTPKIIEVLCERKSKFIPDLFNISKIIG